LFADGIAGGSTFVVITVVGKKDAAIPFVKADFAKSRPSVAIIDLLSAVLGENIDG